MYINEVNNNPYIPLVKSKKRITGIASSKKTNAINEELDLNKKTLPYLVNPKPKFDYTKGNIIDVYA
ncbi:hypothetical protein HOK68_04410 [Candidatus Woesearchaeota archaeon]|jgi:hypothetical protein|nr:hypothetical protein [Candidatus Woesearchaeota archaeon]MBT4595840.1 hypothetical protein [Candidatus Woesearchaeota archaeon]MBT5741311.1 hypothetical protein [Candidatus Woesearchaeota archaeon]MBT6505993.1 hypothetical protein [Candidatus Woesearchaeota archaeon]MBT7297113.1 hypothetical protein [Candidatus Woesearchaeota archaeon]